MNPNLITIHHVSGAPSAPRCISRARYDISHSQVGYAERPRPHGSSAAAAAAAAAAAPFIISAARFIFVLWASRRFLTETRVSCGPGRGNECHIGIIETHKHLIKETKKKKKMKRAGEKGDNVASRPSFNFKISYQYSIQSVGGGGREGGREGE